MYPRIAGFAVLALILSGCGGDSTVNVITEGEAPPALSPANRQVPPSAINHMILVVMQNNSFDHLFGTYPNANGLDPTAPSYQQVDQAGSTVHPQLLTNLSPSDLNHRGLPIRLPTILERWTSTPSQTATCRW